MDMNIFIVVPTIRSLDFLMVWKDEFSRCTLIVVEDHPSREIVSPTKGFKKIYHYCWEDIRKDFGEDEWIFSRCNAGIRSYGFWKAYTLGADMVITLDDDCYPVEKEFVRRHVDNLSTKAPDKWFTTFPHPSYMYTRGFPYKNRNTYKVVISHGLWSNKMDLDAKTQHSLPEDYACDPYFDIRQFVPFGNYFPMSSMNLAFAREVVPLMYFLLMGTDKHSVPWGFDRYDDIWCGVIAKKILDHLKLAVVNGSPFVEHRKASLVRDNLEKEKAGLVTNETLWRSVDNVVLTKKTIVGCYKELIAKVQFPDETYFHTVKKAMLVWIKLFP
jgi:reversibly glycosylated polypeptide / UDP-arabinopyranose mutase